MTNRVISGVVIWRIARTLAAYEGEHGTQSKEHNQPTTENRRVCTACVRPQALETKLPSPVPLPARGRVRVGAVALRTPTSEHNQETMKDRHCHACVRPQTTEGKLPSPVPLRARGRVRPLPGKS